MNEHLIRLVEDKLVDTMLLAQTLYKRTFEFPRLSFELNSIKIAGQAIYSQCLIRINPKYLQAHPDYVVNVTVPHEVAHLICYKLYPNAKQHHGPEWRSIMRDFGLKPSTYHTMDLPEVKPHLYTCQCKNQKYYLSNLIHKRIMFGQRHFCRCCKKQIIYVNSN